MHNYLKNIIPLLLCTGLILFQIEPASAISIRELLGLDSVEDTQNDKGKDKPVAANEKEIKTDNKNTATTTTGGKENPAPKSAEESPQQGLDYDYIRNVINNMGLEQKTAVLADEETFKQFVQSEANNRSVISAAIANKLDRDSNTLFLMQRGAENILRETYLNRLLATKIPADFPSDQQVAEYYEKNKDKFVIGRRAHVWQIFLPMDKDIDKKAKADLRKKAESIINDINKGKIDFATAALKYSEHEVSKNNGGYMGLIRLADLIPGIEKPLMELPEGKLSKPVETEAGLHILKRGAVVEEQPIELKQVEPQIRQLMVRQAAAQLRKGVYEQASKTYPVDLKVKNTEEWRLRLRTNPEGKANNPKE